MQQIKTDILHCLGELKGSGKFATVRSADFIFPGLEVAGLGEISFPINKLQAESLIQKAHKAPFGKGSETVYDDKVRSGWEIDATKLSFNNPKWSSFLDEAIEQIKADLGIENYEVKAHLYKLLIYEEGDFFLTHKDSEKEKGMFGTLILNLPAQFTGGELAIRFEGEEVIADFSENPAHSIHYTSFYADCDHEVKPVTSGYRVCLTYNLIQEEKGQKIELQSIGSYVDRLTDVLTSAINKGIDNPLIVLMGHQYTPENFSPDTLKLDDRYKAEVLMRAAEKAGCYVKMCLVTNYIMGIPEYDGYGEYGNNDYDEDAIMHEVFEETTDIKHWVDNQYPSFSYLSIDEEDLIASFNLNDEEPIEKENSGYMGNYGPDLEHWYHYGAIMIWSPKVNAQLLLSQNVKTQLNWINYFNQQNSISKEEKEAVRQILADGLTVEGAFNQETGYNNVATWVINQKDKTFFSKCSLERLQLLFEKIDPENWIKLFSFLPQPVNQHIFQRLAEEITLPILEKWIEIVRALSADENLSTLVEEQLAALPEISAGLETATLQKISKLSLSNLFWIAHFMSPDQEWINKIAENLSAEMSRKYVHDILGAQLLIEKNNSELTEILLQSCRLYLKNKVADQPMAPKDWSRSVPHTQNHRKQWALLKKFLDSPTETTFDYKASKSYRGTVEQAIESVTIDLKTETIKKGSPHILRITKTKAAYQREMGKWNKDRDLLNQLTSL